LAASAAASRGRFPEAVQLLDEVNTGNSVLAADIALTRGWCLRELGDDGATAAFQAAAVDGQVLPEARSALQNPLLRLVVTDAETIATRTDKWDPATETSREQRNAAALAAEQQGVLDEAQARLDEGKIQRPAVKEVTEEDIVVGYVSQAAEKMKAVCAEALGGVLFIDEAYRLVPEHEGHSFGKDAINTLLKYMEDFRDQLVVIVAGYPKEMRRFMGANPGLASRFHFTLSFDSYTAEEIVAIGRHIAAKERIAIAESAWPLLHAEASRLRSTPLEFGTALDVAGNGRYARKVVIACKRERARRLHTLAPGELAELAKADPSVPVVNSGDMGRALESALTYE
jgi:hypothetical protein